MKIHLSSDVHMLDTLLIVHSRNAALGPLIVTKQRVSEFKKGYGDDTYNSRDQNQ